jgi:hypothetical protein
VIVAMSIDDFLFTASLFSLLGDPQNQFSFDDEGGGVYSVQIYPYSRQIGILQAM